MQAAGSYRIIKYKNRHLKGEYYMKSTGLLFLGIAWILASLLWFFIIKNTSMGIIWLCGGTIELIIALIRLNIEKKGGR